MHLSPPADIFGMDGVIVLVVVVVVLFGSTQIPKLARSLGSAQKEFKKGLDEGSSEDTPSSSPTIATPPAVVAPPAQVAPPAHVAPPVQAAAPVESNSDGSAGSPS